MIERSRTIEGKRGSGRTGIGRRRRVRGLERGARRAGGKPRLVQIQLRDIHFVGARKTAGLGDRRRDLSDHPEWTAIVRRNDRGRSPRHKIRAARHLEIDGGAERLTQALDDALDVEEVDALLTTAPVFVGR